MICKKMATIYSPIVSVSESLYCTYTVQVTAMLGDMEDFFTYMGVIGRDDDIRINSFNSQ